MNRNIARDDGSTTHNKQQSQRLPRTEDPLRVGATRHLLRLFTPWLILLGAAILRFYHLSSQSLWADEGNSIALARRSFSEIIQRTAFDIHPPFYYWLLKLWISIFGDTEIGLRSLSVILGLGLIYLTGVLGTRLFNPRVGLIAAFIAAFSPLQIYYSQEARMYILLAFLSSLTVLVASLILKSEAGRRSEGKEDGQIPQGLKFLTGFIYILTVTAGLYTHYAYPLILLAVNLAGLIWFWPKNWQVNRLVGWKSHISYWLALHLIPLLLYLPWGPIAWRQLTTWPSEKETASLPVIVETISTALLFGLSWPFNSGYVAASSLTLALLVTLWLILYLTYRAARGNPASQLTFYVSHLAAPLSLSLPLFWLWFLLPVALTILIFSPAFLKFLLVATPALALLLALVIDYLTLFSQNWLRYPAGTSRPTTPQPVTWLGYLAGGTLLASLTSASAISLYHYYNNPIYARDNYRGLVNFIKAVSGPADAVILNAEGQQDVFNYYYEGSPVSTAPVHPLPRRRPLDEAATLKELQQITQRAETVYAVYWATQQADPTGLIEGWLDTHLFKATDQWYGNVRLVSYANSQVGPDFTPMPVEYHLGQHIRLTGYALASDRVIPGDILKVVLTWETDAALSPAENYTVFLQLLDSANHVVGQRDALPFTPIPNWPAKQAIVDPHGIFIEPGTPPGPHRLIVGLYHPETGQRLPVLSPADNTTASSEVSQDFIELSQVEIIRPDVPLPLEAFKMQVTLNEALFDLHLLGYDLYKSGHRSTPDTPLHAGDLVHLVAYWLPRQPVYTLQDQLFIQVVTNLGGATPVLVTRQLAGVDYPIKEWRAGEVVRAQYDFFLNNVEPGLYRLALTLGGHETSTRRAVAVTQPFKVE